MNEMIEKEPLLDKALEAISKRVYYTPYPENPKAYEADKDSLAKAWISSAMNNNFNELEHGGCTAWIGEEVSPYTQIGIGVAYPKYEIDTIITRANNAYRLWKEMSLDKRASILIESLDQIKDRFFDIAYATMHTTGQSFLMSFQASGPHSNDRALEAMAMGVAEMSRYANEVEWVKPMGKFDLKVNKTFKAIPKGIGLVIGCSTFPVWNSVPGIFANLITGNACVVKPHPKAVLPIAIVVAEIQKVIKKHGLDVNVIQLAVDTIEQPITKQLAEHSDVKMIDYTGGSEFGNYIEGLNKTTFTEKAGVNSLIIDSVSDVKAVAANIAFSTSLYSGQMCTAPQNIFVSKDGVQTPNGVVTFDDFCKELADAYTSLIDNPKAGPAVLGAIQSDVTLNRVKQVEASASSVLVHSKQIINEEFSDARICSPVVLKLTHSDSNVYNSECFGPIVFVIKTDSLEQSVTLAKELAKDKGALTCGAYCIDEQKKKYIADEMNGVFVPVSFNFTGAGFINSHAAFSDFHLTGGNAAGNASFTNSDFISRRFVWVGNRYM